MTNAIIDQVLAEYKPSHVFALFSGGDDSICALHLAAQYARFSAAVLIDTGIAVAETHAHAASVCKAHKWPLLVIPTPIDYAYLVRKYGFPGPDAHRYMYNYLKERVVRRLVRQFKTGPKDRIVLITGVRQQESQRRMESVTAPIVREGAKVWCAPMWQWTTAERNAYQTEHKLEHNPVKDKLHVSGDCLCGAYADKGDLAILRTFYPAEAARIDALREEVKDKFPWDWDEAPPKWFQQHKAGQQFLGSDFMPLCWACAKHQEAV